MKGSPRPPEAGSGFCRNEAMQDILGDAVLMAAAAGTPPERLRSVVVGDGDGASAPQVTRRNAMRRGLLLAAAGIGASFSSIEPGLADGPKEEPVPDSVDRRAREDGAYFKPFHVIPEGYSREDLQTRTVPLPPGPPGPPGPRVVIRVPSPAPRPSPRPWVEPWRY